MKHAQHRLDQAARRARKLETETREFAAMIRAAADEVCASKEFDLSADLHAIAALYGQASETMRQAYSLGRRLRATDDDTGEIVRPMGGGKD